MEDLINLIRDCDMGLFSDFLGKHTGPNDHLQAGRFEMGPDDLDAVPTTNKAGDVVHEVPKDLNQEINEIKEAFNNASEPARVVFIQKLVRSYPDEVREYLKEVS